MENRERLINLYLLFIGPLSLVAVGSALYSFPTQKIDLGLLAVAAVTVCLGSVLRIQLPRNNIHLTISDSLIMMTMLVYGEQAAVVLAVLEGAITSVNFRRKGVPVKSRTILMNMQIAAIGFFLTAEGVVALIGTEPRAITGLDFSSFAVLMLGISLSLFVLNTLLLTPFLSLKSDKSIWKVWSEYCLDALVMYLISGVMAGVMFKSLEQIDVFMFAGVIGIFGLLYWAYRRNIDDVRKTSAEARDAERRRAEQAETHLEELEHYVSQLEKTGEALRDSREKFRYAAFHDALTNRPNRNKFVDEINKLIDAGETTFALLFFDLKNFKTVNESLGYSAGDKLLNAVADRVADAVKDECLFGRFGGDEFGLLLPRIKSEMHASLVAKRIVSNVGQPFFVDDRQVFTSTNIGITYGNGEYMRAEEVLRDADIAMYYAKDGHKPFIVFDTEMRQLAVRRLELETDLRLAVERKEFELFYQPIVSMDDLSLSGFEALVRWNHPTRGLVSPIDFIPLAESTGLVIPMTIDILRAGCNQLVEWERRIGKAGTMMLSVNLSVTHFSDAALVDQIKSIILETGIRPSSLKLEITESAVMENAESAIAMLKRIKAAGVSISIDDFGTGYSSLSYLHRFPLDYLKIDRSFVNAMDDGSENREIVRTIVALAKALKLAIIAEGIETQDQLERLRELGCEFGQGYLFSRPLPANEIEPMLSETFSWSSLDRPFHLGTNTTLQPRIFS